MKLLLCLVLAVAIFRVQCDDLPASKEATKDETQPSENQGTDLEENNELANSNVDDYYDYDSSEWDSLDDTDVEETDGEDLVKPTGLPDTNSVDVDEAENQFLDDDDEDEDDDDDDVAWLMQSSTDAQLDDGGDSMEDQGRDSFVEDKDNSGDSWSYTKYLEQKGKERTFRKFVFAIIVFSSLTLGALMLLIAMCLRKRSANKKAMPYDHLHEEA